MSPTTSYDTRAMSDDPQQYLMEKADEIVPLLYDYARRVAGRYGWQPGQTMPLGKLPQDIVSEVYASYMKGFASGGNRIKGARHFDPEKDLMLQIKGAVRSVIWALHERASAKNEVLFAAEEDDDDPRDDIASNDSNPFEALQSADFARAALAALRQHLSSKPMLEDLLACYELNITEVSDQARELKISNEDVSRARYELRQIYLHVVSTLNSK